MIPCLTDIAGHCKGGINCICRKYGCVNTGEFMLGNIPDDQENSLLLFKFQL